jgi:hypothetical protein
MNNYPVKAILTIYSHYSTYTYHFRFDEENIFVYPEFISKEKQNQYSNPNVTKVFDLSLRKKYVDLISDYMDNTIKSHINIQQYSCTLIRSEVILN